MEGAASLLKIALPLRPKMKKMLTANVIPLKKLPTFWTQAKGNQPPNSNHIPFIIPF
jgi:hypothetical protein